MKFINVFVGDEKVRERRKKLLMSDEYTWTQISAIIIIMLMAGIVALAGSYTVKAVAVIFAVMTTYSIYRFNL